MIRRRKQALSPRSSALIAGAVIGMCVIPFSLRAQTGSFDSGSDGSDGALFIEGSLRSMTAFASVYDAARAQVVTFGGEDRSSRRELDETYVFDGTSWRRVAREPAPESREEASIAYDAARQRVVMFGGSLDSYSSEHGNETWLWDGTAWSLAQPTVAPPRPYSAQQAMAFNPASGLVTLVLREEFASETLQTWTFDGSNWTLRAATIPRYPDSRMQMAYDANLQRLTLLIRSPDGGLDTWYYDGLNWVQPEIAPLPENFVDSGRLVYDGREGHLAYYAYGDAYRLDASGWQLLENVPIEFSDGIEGLVYHPGMDALLRMNGWVDTEAGDRIGYNDTWAWYADGSVEMLTSGERVFDMTEKPDGLWQFTTIEIGPNVHLTFTRNSDNTPVRWLASGDVQIDGIVDVSAAERRDSLSVGSSFSLGSFSGPGGHDGASSGPLGREMIVPGGGPDGGFSDGASVNRRDGEFSSYGNAWLYPLAGGSGGGSYGTGTGGGGGGGAILIASSGTLTLNGQIRSLPERQSNSSAAPYGSGGAVLLRANVVAGVGSVSVDTGRRRIEGWERPIEEGMNNSVLAGREAGVPLLPADLSSSARKLWVDSIGGVTLSNPPLSHNSLVDPDAILEAGGSVTVVVKGENIPFGATVSIFVTLEDGSVIEPAPVAYDGSQAVFSIDVTEGFGAIAAKATMPFGD